MSSLTFRIAGGTNVGLVRKNNEDNFIVNPNLTQSEWFLPADSSESFKISDYGALMVVADGMGGMNAGEVASAIAIDTIKEEFTNHNLSKIVSSNRKIENFLYDIIVKADSNIKAHVEQEPETEGMGTTIVIAWILRNVVHIAWCGDSRAYLYNNKVGLSRLSKDHSYVQQLVDEGKLDDDLAFDHPNSNIITRSLGDASSKARPDYMSKYLSDGDMIILCSDGLCGLCRDSEILELLNIGCEEGFNMEQFKNALITAALQAGGYDNVTLTLMSVDNVSQLQFVESDDDDDAATLNDFKQAKKRKNKSRVIYILVLLICILAVLSFAAVKIIPLWDSIEATVKEWLMTNHRESDAETDDKPSVKSEEKRVVEDANVEPEAKNNIKSGSLKKIDTKKSVNVVNSSANSSSKAKVEPVITKKVESNNEAAEKIVLEPENSITEKKDQTPADSVSKSDTANEQPTSVTTAQTQNVEKEQPSVANEIQTQNVEKEQPSVANDTPIQNVEKESQTSPEVEATQTQNTDNVQPTTPANPQVNAEK